MAPQPLRTTEADIINRIANQIILRIICQLPNIVFSFWFLVFGF